MSLVEIMLLVTNISDGGVPPSLIKYISDGITTPSLIVFYQRRQDKAVADKLAGATISDGTVLPSLI